MRENLYNEVRTWIYRNARYIDICLWKYLFESGDKEDVIDALMNYQNEDGGFGHALEADSWNPNSSPITTEHALIILDMIDFQDMNHPIYKGIWKYLNSEKELADYGWRFSIASNDEYPHAPWWNYSEENNKKWSSDLTAELSSFILRFGDKESKIYKKALEFTSEFFEKLMSDSHSEDMAIEGYIYLIDTAKELEIGQYDYDKLTMKLAQNIKNSIEHDMTKWNQYVVMPSRYIKSPSSIFYSENKDIMNKEIQYLLKSKPDNDVWPITWTWFDNMDKYSKEFDISENWWKGFKAIETMVLLRNFDAV